MSRLPQPGSDKGTWGDVLNDFLAQSHNIDGTIKNGAVTTAMLDAPTQSAIASAAPALTNAAVQAANFTATVNSFNPVNAGSGVIAVTLPASPADKARLTIKKVDTTANVVTITTSGGAVFNRAGGVTSLTLQLPNQSVALQYAAANSIWYVVSDDLPASWVSLGVTKTVAGNYTVVATDHVILADTTSASFTVTLPTAVGYYGRLTITSATGANIATVAASSSQTIAGAGTVTVGNQASGAAYSSLDLVSDGANWAIV